jgi:sterol desaturase/sphingolipid hydroxylase (fatty acid hydroxylase superfamily)
MDHNNDIISLNTTNLAYEKTNELINTIIQSTYDIIHLHIYPFILFRFIKTIINTKFREFLFNIILTIFLHNIMIITFSNYYFLDNIERQNNNRRQTDDIGIFFHIYILFKYICLVEFLTYIYHRLLHSCNFFNIIHNHKEEYYYLLISPIDIIFRMICMHLPLYYINIYYFDLNIIYFFYIYNGINIRFNKFAIIHKKSKKYNFGELLPIYDIIFDTYLSESLYESLNEIYGDELS